MFEKKHQPIASKKTVLMRLVKTSMITALGLSIWLTVGVVGYHITCKFSWIDSLLNASMILSGMGPTSSIDNNLGKVFASLYAIFSGVIFITSVGVLLSPIVHRFMHQLNLPKD
jgi:hypothetical protein